MAKEQIFTSYLSSIKSKLAINKIKQRSTIFYLMLLMFSQLNLSYGSELGNASAGNSLGHLSHSENINPYNRSEINNTLASVNPAIVNPAIDVAQVISSVLHSSLNLSSLNANFNVGNLPHSVSINVNGHSDTITNNQYVTPAEAVAINQVLATSHQSLILGENGNAIGGSLNASNLTPSNTSNALNNLELPSNVTLIAGNNLVLKGDLQNYGDIVLSNNGNLQANLVLNENSGLISSSGNLNITTNALINESGGIYAGNSLSLITPVIYNEGTIEASLGNVNIASANNLDITGTANSIIESNSGNINLNSSASSLSNGLNLAFGNYLSKELNLDASQGYINAGINNVTGQINSQSDSEHLFTQSANMTIGNSNIKGDPTYDNTGNILIDGAIATNGNNLAIVAGGSIGVTSGSTTSINTTVTSSGGGNGGNVVMIAGVGTNLTGYSNQTPTITPGLTGETSTISVALGATSGNTGGNIDLSTGNILGNGNFVIYTNGTGSNASGGNVTLVAQANGSTGGQINVGNSTNGYFVNTVGVGTGTNGNVLMIATGNSGTPTPYNDIQAAYITTGAINATTTGGNVLLYVANPTAQTVTFGNTGTIGSGQVITANTASLIPGSINVSVALRSPVSNGSDVTLATGLTSGVGIYVPTLLGDNMFLTTSGADIGTSTGSTGVGGTNLTVNTNAIGSVYLYGTTAGLTNSLSINSWTGDNFYFTSVVNQQPVILAGYLISNSSNGVVSFNTGTGNLTYDGNITASSINININAGSLIENNTGAVITSTNSSLSLSASSSIGSSSNPIFSNSGTINLTEIANSSNTYIQNNYAGGQQLYITYNSNVTTLGTFDYSFASNLTLNNNIETASTINLSGLSPDNAGIAIGSNLLAATTSITLAASGSGNITEASGNFQTLQTPDLVLSSGTGSIGTFSIPIFAYTTGSPTSTVAANTGGTGNVYLDISPQFTSGTITFNASTAGGTFSDYGTGNSIIVNGNIVAPVISLGGDVSSIFNTSLTLNASVIGSISVSLYALNAGSIIQSSTSDAISAPTVNLITVSNTLPPPPYGSSNIGSSTNPLVVSNVTTALNVGTTGAVYISSPQNVALGNIGASSSMPSSFQLTSSNDITSAGSSYMAYAGSITLTALGTNGVGTTNSYVNVDTANLNVSANAATTSSAYINDAYSGGTAITLGTGNPSITIGSSGTLGFEASNNAILIGASISASEIDLTAKGTITQSLTSDILTAGTINLQTYGSAIGSSITPLEVVTSNIGVNTTLGSSTASASAYLSDSMGPVTIGTSLIPFSFLGSSGTFSLTETATNGEIIISGAVTAGTIDLTSTSSGNGSIGGIQEIGAGAATLKATNVNLTDTGTGTGINGEDIGATGSGSTGAILTQTANLAVTTTLGSAYLSNYGAVTLGASSVNSANGNYVLNTSPTTAGSDAVTIGNNSVSGFNISISTSIILSGGNADIIQSGTGSLQAANDNLNLSSAGNIGASGNPILVNSIYNNLQAVGNVYVSDASTTSNLSGVNYSGSNVNPGNTSTFDFIASSAGSAVTVNSATSVTGGTVTLQSDASSGSFVFITGPVTGNTSINILSGGSITTTRLGTSDSTPILNLTSIYNSIGSSSSVLSVDAAQVSANANAASQNVYIIDTYAGATSIGASSAGAGGIFFFSNPGQTLSSVTATSIAAPTVILSGASVATTLTGTSILTAEANSTTSSNGTVNITDTGIGGSLTLTSATVGTNTYTNEGINTGSTGSYTLSADNTATTGILTATSSSVTANTVSLTSTAGNIGESGGSPSAIALVSPNLTLSAANGSIYATDSGNTLLTITANSPISSSGTFSLTNSGSILVSANIGTGSATTGIVDLTTIGSSSYTVNSSASDFITAGNINLNTNGGDIGSSSQGINVDTANLTASTLNNSSTTGSAYVNDLATTTVNLGGTASTGTNVANISVGTAGTLSLTVAAANINVASNVSVGLATGSGTIDLTSETAIGTGTNAGIITSTGNTLTAANVGLNTNGSDIGSSNQGINVNTANLTASTLNNSSTTGSAYVNDSATTTVNLGGTASTGTNVANMSVGTAGTLILTATAANINIASNVSVGSATGSGTINLTSDTATGTGTSAGIITSTGNTLTAANVGLNTNGSDIGSSSQGINVNTANLTASTLNNSSTTGSAYVNDLATTTVNLGGTATSGVNVANISVGTAGTLSLTATVANINVAGNVSVGSATGSGTINLTSDTATGTGTNAGLISGTGDVLTSGTINLNTNGSDIGSGGSSGQSIVVNTSNIALSTLNNSSINGSAYINDTATSLVNLNASSVGSTNNVLAVTFNGSVVINGMVTAGSDTSSGSINLALTGNGTVTDSGNLDILQAGAVNFNTAGGNIGGQFSILVDTSNVSVNTLNSGATTGYAYITDSAANLNINSSSVSTQTYSSTSLSMYITNSGNININGQVSSGTPLGTGSIGVACLNSNASVTDSSSSSILTAGLVYIQTVGGNIGSSNQNILLNANNFDITTLASSSTTGSAFISDSSTATINLGSSHNLIDVGGSGTLSLTATLANINVANNVSVGLATGSGTIDLTVSGSNSITQSSTSDLLTAGTIDLTASSTNFGSSATNMFTLNTSNLSANTTGNGYIQDNAATSNILASSFGSYLTLNTAGTVNTNGNVTASTIILNTANNGNINVNANLGQSSSSVSLSTNNNGYITTGSHGVIIANSLSLVSPNGEIGFNGQGLITQANNVIFSANLSVGINNTSSSLNIGASGSGANLYVFNSGNITASGLISAPVLGLYSFTGTSGVGSANSLIQVNAHNVAFETLNNQGSVYINDTYNGNVTVQNSQVGNVFKLDTVSGVLLLGLIDQNNVISQGQISGSIVAIATSGGFGILNASPINSNDFIFLTASQNGYIAQQNGYQGSTSILTAPNVALVSGGGAIGGASGTSLLVNSGKVAVSTLGAGGYVYIYDEAANSGINGGQSGSYFTFNTNGNVNIYGSIATGAGVNANGGSLNISGNGLINIGVGSAVSLLANNGNIVVQDNNSASGSIHLYNSDTVSTKAIDPSLGSVVFNVGTYSEVNNNNPNPSNITVNTAGTGKVYFGTNGITAASGGNVLNALNQNIVFNTGSLNANSLTLGGNVKITADPIISNKTNTALKPINSEELYGKTALFMPIAYHQIAENEINSQLSYVIKASQNLEFKVLNNTVKLKAGAIVLIAANNNTVSIYNLHDKVNGSVRVNIANNKLYVIKPGSQLTVVINNTGIYNKFGNTFANINMLEKVGYRGIKQVSINNINIFKSDYSIVSAISALNPLMKMAKSSDINMRKAYNDILKTAAVVNQTTVYKGLYERQVKSESKFISSL